MSKQKTEQVRISNSTMNPFDVGLFHRVDGEVKSAGRVMVPAASKDGNPGRSKPIDQGLLSSTMGLKANVKALFNDGTLSTAAVNAE